MIVKVKNLKVGDLIQASWLGRGWHEVFLIEECGFDSRKMHMNIEGFKACDIYKDEEVERK